MKTKRDHDNHPPFFHVNENVSLEEQIAQRAHELWHQRGREHGSDLDDWLRAEEQITEWHQKRLGAKTSRRSG